MSGPVVEVRNVSKCYRIRGQREPYLSLRDELGRRAASLFRPRSAVRSRSEDFWALRDVSFSVNEGEAFGIIGRNGAGKSTLLKVLTKITPPTEGRITMRGRVASLLEVGTGFHPELTGRENVYLNGAVLGMTRAEVKRKFDDIVAFAENDKFLDTPVKRYSSGMYVRLAFAVAAHLDPEIMLVDEVLAVGDAAFQKKCLGKMGKLARGSRTVLFVSHNMVAVQSLCDRTVWLDGGVVVREGRSSAVIAEYLRSSVGTASSGQVWDDPATAPGDGPVRLHRVCTRMERDTPSGLITMDSPFRIEVNYWNQVRDSRLNVTLLVTNEQGVTAFTTGNAADQRRRRRPLEVGLYRSTCHVPGNLLNSGRYRVTLLVVKDGGSAVYRHDDILSIDVVDLAERQAGWLGREPGVVQPLLEWTTEPLVDEHPAPGAAPDG